MNVYELAQERMKLTFEEFDNVMVSFSGGKDSGVMLNMAIEYARKIGRKISVMHMDYEAQYTMTTNYVNETLAQNRDVCDVYRICVPFKVSTCTSMFDDHWRPWDADKKEIWVSELPKECFQKEDFDYYTPEMWDYEFQERFATWLHKRNNAKRTGCLIGIRTQESFHRWKAIHAERRGETNYKDWNWSTFMTKGIYNLYPIFDWKTEDIWIANGRFGWSYNKLYDLFYQAGVPLNEMRVASPFLSTAQDSLKLYRVIEPNTWSKLVGRVNGVNFTGIYGGTTAMGWKSIKLPAGHTWKSYMEFLLSTLPEDSANRYKKKLEFSIKFWQTKGGEVALETIQELEDAGIEVTAGELNPITNRKKIQLEYLDDFDTKEFKLLPTYKRICICIMKNDHALKYAGFGQTKEDWAKRTSAETAFKNIQK